MSFAYEDPLEEAPPSTPAWMLTFGDMMGLLLTFFILLVSMSEIREDDRFQGVTDSIQERFGYEAGLQKIPGESHPRHALLASLALSGRDRRAKSHATENPASSPLVLHGMDDAQVKALRRWTKNVGRDQTVEIRGQATADQVDLAFQRARGVMQLLTSDLKFEASRVRITIAATAHDSSEPLEIRLVNE